MVIFVVEAFTVWCGRVRMVDADEVVEGGVVADMLETTEETMERSTAKQFVRRIRW